MTTLYSPVGLPDSFGLCDHHSQRPMRAIASIWGLTPSDDETVGDIIVQIEAERAALGRPGTLFHSFEGECLHCQEGIA